MANPGGASFAKAGTPATRGYRVATESDIDRRAAPLLEKADRLRGRATTAGTDAFHLKNVGRGADARAAVARRQELLDQAKRVEARANRLLGLKSAIRNRAARTVAAGP